MPAGHGRQAAPPKGWFVDPLFITYILCAFLTLYVFKPSEPHLTRYLRERGFSPREINDEIYPISTYFYVPWLLLATALAETTSFRGVILLTAAARIGTRLLLISGTTVISQVWMEVLYSAGSASEVLFFALAYIVMPASEYGSVTGAIQGTYLTVHILAAVAGDALLHTRAMNLTGLVWLSSIGVALAILCGAVFFPSQVSLWQAPARGRQGLPTAGEVPRAPVQAPQPRLRTPARIAGDFLVCRTAWLECCVSRRRLYGQTTPPSPASGEESLAQRAGFIWRLLRRVYSDAAFVLVALWWCLVGDPVYQNVYNFESSLYDALLPGAKADFNGSFVAASLALGAAMSFGYGCKTLQRFARANSAWVLLGISLANTALLAVVGQSRAIAHGRTESTALALCALFLYFGLHALGNALYYDVTSCAIEQARVELGSAEKAGAIPPVFIVFTLNSCTSLAVQSFSTWLIFQAQHLAMLPAYTAFAGMLACAPLVLLAGYLCRRRLRTQRAEAEYSLLAPPTSEMAPAV